MADGRSEELQATLSRARWRLRGAWMWPTFVLLTVAEAIVLHLLPATGESTRMFSAFLVCGFLNLALIGLVAPLAGRVLRRRRPALPQDIATDRAGTVLLCGFSAALLAVGLAHHSAVVGARDEFALQTLAARRYFGHQAPRAYAGNVDQMDTWRSGPHFWRSCVPGPDPRRHLCVFVNTENTPFEVSRDADQRPNAVMAGPDNPGRRAG